jgi:hypothetical protein
LSFTFITRSVDDNTEYFVLERSDDNGVSFSIVKSWVYGTDFENDSRYFESLKMNGPFTSYTKFRLRSIFSTNSDWVYFDDIEIKACLYGIGLKETLVEHNFRERMESKASVSGFDWTLYPNPVANQLTIEINSDEKVTSFINILNIRGEQIYRKTTLLNIGTNMIELNVMDLHSGIYIIQIISPKGKIIDRFIKE